MLYFSQKEKYLKALLIRHFSRISVIDGPRTTIGSKGNLT